MLLLEVCRQKLSGIGRFCYFEELIFQVLCKTKSMDQVVLYGNGSLTKEIICYNDFYKLFEVSAIIDDSIEGANVCNDIGIPVLNFTEFQKSFPANVAPKILITIGYTRCNCVREKVYKNVKNLGYQCANFISPRATIWADLAENDNVIILDNVFVGPQCRIGNGVVICPGTLLSHGVTVDNFVFISDGVVVGGNAKIGKNSFLGLNSTIKSSSKIGEKNIVASAANVIHDSEPSSVLKGNPAVAVIKDTISVQI